MMSSWHRLGGCVRSKIATTSSFSLISHSTKRIAEKDACATRLRFASKFNNSNSFAPSNLKCQHYQYYSQLRNFSSLIVQSHQADACVLRNVMAAGASRRYISRRQVTKNLILYSNDPNNAKINANTLEISRLVKRPLVVVLSWMMAQQKHLRKFSEIYTDIGFDVLIVQPTPWQLLWPTKGTQVVASDVLKFLENNKLYAPIVIHGFSVGAYQFGEVLLQMARDVTRYQPIIDRVACQIWDSAADVTEIPIGLPKSVFPNNPRMEAAFRNYTLYHLKTFHNQATIHYMRSSQMFHSTLIKKPALFFVSKNDPIGPPSSSNAVRENWERANIPVTFKCWDRSLHASHFTKHRDEYLEFLFKHLENSGVLETVGQQSHAKL